MDFGDTTLLTTFKQRLAWLGQRQQVLAQNIANADTPGYRPHDIEPFRDLIAGGSRPLAVHVTSPRHLVGGDRQAGPHAERPMARTYEVAPAGNAVILEEQVAKVNETNVAHRLTTQLYKKYLGMVRMVASARG